MPPCFVSPHTHEIPTYLRQLTYALRQKLLACDWKKWSVDQIRSLDTNSRYDLFVGVHPALSGPFTNQRSVRLSASRTLCECPFRFISTSTVWFVDVWNYLLLKHHLPETVKWKWDISIYENFSKSCVFLVGSRPDFRSNIRYMKTFQNHAYLLWAAGLISGQIFDIWNLLKIMRVF